MQSFLKAVWVLMPKMCSYSHNVLIKSLSDTHTILFYLTFRWQWHRNHNAGATQSHVEGHKDGQSHGLLGVLSGWLTESSALYSGRTSGQTSQEGKAIDKYAQKMLLFLPSPQAGKFLQSYVVIQLSQRCINFANVARLHVFKRHLFGFVFSWI